MEVKPQDIEQISQDVVKIVRQQSRHGRLVNLEELVSSLAPSVRPADDNPDPHILFRGALTDTVASNLEIREIEGQNGESLYYSTLDMTPEYAGILAGQGSLSLIADIIRENSRIYPRPVPLELFKQPPFELGDQEITEYLGQMKSNPEYSDISITITSTGAIFLYSTDSMDPAYANSLAEWIDVGASNNP